MSAPETRAGAAATPGTPRFIPLWHDTERKEQRRRLDAMHLQSCDKEGQLVWERANALKKALPEGVRVDLPSPRVFARVLGLYRSAGMLKHRAMAELELSVEDIAELLGYSKTTIEAALRWLGDAPIVVRGMRVATGLGYIVRARRKAGALVEGVVQQVYRTTKTALSAVGRALVGLEAIIKAVQRSVAKAKAAIKQYREEIGLTAAAFTPGEANWEAGRIEIANIRKQLGG